MATDKFLLTTLQNRRPFKKRSKENRNKDKSIVLQKITAMITDNKVSPTHTSSPLYPYSPFQL